jgi:hypothetical protein
MGPKGISPGMTNEQAVESFHVKTNAEYHRHRNLKAGRVRTKAMFNTITTKTRVAVQAVGSNHGEPVPRPKRVKKYKA